MTNNVWVRKISKDNSSLHVNLPSEVQSLGFKFKSYVKVKICNDNSIRIEKLDLS